MSMKFCDLNGPLSRQKAKLDDDRNKNREIAL